jgi:hypothetical protein
MGLYVDWYREFLVQILQISQRCSQLDTIDQELQTALFAKPTVRIPKEPTIRAHLEDFVIFMRSFFAKDKQRKDRRAIGHIRSRSWFTNARGEHEATGASAPGADRPSQVRPATLRRIVFCMIAAAF